MLMAELHNGVLKVYEQVPYVEDALALAYRQTYLTCEDMYRAANTHGISTVISDQTAYVSAAIPANSSPAPLLALPYIKTAT